MIVLPDIIRAASIRLILWAYRLLHLTPLMAIILLPVGKWLAAIIAALWPLWVLGVLCFELGVLHRWLGPALTRAARDALRDAEAGDAAAQYRIGRMFDQANQGFNSSQKHHIVAMNWYRRAAAQGHADAVFALAEHLMGNDFHEAAAEDEMPPHPDDPISNFRRQRMINAAAIDRTEAAQYYRVAAARGHARAQGRLGELYRIGNAVPKNRIAAYIWLSRAVAGMAAADASEFPAPKRAQRPEDSEREEELADYHAFAAALAHLEQSLTPGQIRQAQARAKVKAGTNHRD